MTRRLSAPASLDSISIELWRELWDERWDQLIALNPDLTLSGHDCSIDIHLASEKVERYLRISTGQLVEVKTGPLAMHRSDVSFTASESTWQSFWSKTPPPGFHDIFAMSSYGHMKIRGDTNTLLQHLGFVKRLLVIPRRISG